MVRLKTILLVFFAALLLADVAQCFSSSEQMDSSMECCRSMPCSPANHNHDCCKKMVVQRAPYILPARPPIPAALVAVGAAPSFSFLLTLRAPALLTETRDHAPPPYLANTALPLLI